MMTEKSKEICYFHVRSFIRETKIFFFERYSVLGEEGDIFTLLMTIGFWLKKRWC